MGLTMSNSKKLSKGPITVYFSDNQSPEIYRLTADQINIFQDSEWEGIEKFKVEVDTHDRGYAPAWLVKLGEIYGFDVESI